MHFGRFLRTFWKKYALTSIWVSAYFFWKCIRFFKKVHRVFNVTNWFTVTLKCKVHIFCLFRVLLSPPLPIFSFPRKKISTASRFPFCQKKESPATCCRAFSPNYNPMNTRFVNLLWDTNIWQPHDIAKQILPQMAHLFFHNLSKKRYLHWPPNIFTEKGTFPAQIEHAANERNETSACKSTNCKLSMQIEKSTFRTPETPALLTKKWLRYYFGICQRDPCGKLFRVLASQGVEIQDFKRKREFSFSESEQIRQAFKLGASTWKNNAPKFSL